ncbi:MAG: hypothetical protein JNL87_16440 [Burkholderiaceae bacterium]|nr:hypothetical protein [Burkholderiaceae bacterium]
MLGSLFGDLAPQRLPQANASAATVVALSDDIVFDASPAAAIREHFAAHRSDLQRASAMLTLLDPSRLWASQVLHALSDATARPLQRLNLRERTTRRTLAVIERALVPRRDADALRVYHADIRASALEVGLAQEEIGTALAEGSQLTAVIVGAMQPQALAALLRSLLQATRQPEWRCPQLVFILPPGAVALRQRILDQPWPPQVQASAVAGSLACAAGVWNSVLEAWEAGSQAPTAAAQRCAPRHAISPAGPRRSPGEVLPPALNRLLAALAASDGLLACGIVDVDAGELLVSRGHAGPATDLAAPALALCAARRALESAAGTGDDADEILFTAGPRQALLRTLPGGDGLGVVALLDRQQANLGRVRLELLEVERGMA